MRKLLSALSLTVLLVGCIAQSALAANPQQASTLSTTGNDISWPQCGKSLPSGQAFGVVGVTGGTAATTNPCLSQQLTWATRSTGSVASQPKVQLYINTANPGEVIDQITTWPVNNTDETSYTTQNPYGDCDGTNNLPCSWQYGWNRAVEAARDRLAPAATPIGLSTSVASYTWWLDVETGNTWQSGSVDAYARNTAALEGMAKYFQNNGGKVGLYSTAYQWGKIVSTTVSSSSNLNGLDSWLAGARSAKDAPSFCSKSSLTSGGKVTLAQYISKNLDYDYACN